MDKKETPIISFVANSGTGKTTLLEKLVRLLKERGHTVAVIKHDAHRFDIDVPGKDSYRLTAAGADTVAITAADKTAIIHQTEEMMALDDLIRLLPPADILLTEGFRFSTAHPRIEIFRAPVSTSLISREEDLLAVATNMPLTTTAPCLDLDDAPAIATFIERYMANFKAK